MCYSIIKCGNTDKKVGSKFGGNTKNVYLCTRQND